MALCDLLDGEPSSHVLWDALGAVEHVWTLLWNQLMTPSGPELSARLAAGQRNGTVSTGAGTGG